MDGCFGEPEKIYAVKTAKSRTAATTPSLSHLAKLGVRNVTGSSLFAPTGQGTTVITAMCGSALWRGTASFEMQ